MFIMSKIANNSVRTRFIKVALLAWLREGKQLFKFHGNKEEIEVVQQAFQSSKNLHEEINRGDSTVKSIMTALGDMRRDTKKFEKLYGIKWPM